MQDNRRRRIIRATVAALAALLCAALLAGCGSGSGSATPPPGSQYVTRADEAIYSQDAKVLAARIATGPFLSRADTQRFDADLTAIRAKYPVLANIHATPDYVLTQLLVRVRKDSSWIGRWQSGQITTGQATLDNLLSIYGVTAVGAPVDLGDTEAFTLTFAQSLNMTALAGILQTSDASITAAEVNRVIGGSTRISYAAQSDGSRRYYFQQGAGDCIAGCISNQTWQVTITPNNAITPLQTPTAQ